MRRLLSTSGRQVEAEQRRGHQPEQRQHGIAAADVRRVEERRADNAASAASAIERRARIGDRDEVRARAPAPSAADITAQKCRSSAATSMVVPLLLATRNSAALGTSASVTSRMARSSVVSSTVSASAAVAGRRARRAGPRRTGCCRPCRAGRRRSARRRGRRRRTPQQADLRGRAPCGRVEPAETVDEWRRGRPAQRRTGERGGVALPDTGGDRRRVGGRHDSQSGCGARRSDRQRHS